MSSENPSAKKGNTGITIFIVALVVVILGGGGYFVFLEFQEAQILKKSNTFLSEAESFIENKKFDRAQESIQQAEAVLPNRPEISALQKELERSIKVASLEKELVATLQRRAWPRSTEIVTELESVDPENVAILPAKETIKVGILDQTREALEVKLGEAQASLQLPEIVKFSEELITLDPTHSNSSVWKTALKEAQTEIKVRNEKALTLYKQAKALDQGIYNEQMLTLATEAKELSKTTEITTFYNKVYAYPRTINYPQDYATLQEAVDIARPFDSIKIAPGEYYSPIIVNKEVTLVGDPEKAVIVHCSGKEGAALFVGPEGNVIASSLMFKHSVSASDDQSYSTVVVNGQAKFTSCLFFQSSGHGLHVVDGGKVSIESCRSESNRWDGYAVQGAGSSATIKKSVASKNRQNGLDAWDSGSIEFLDSITEINRQSGAVSLTKGNISFNGSTARSNDHAGFYIANKGTATILNSELSSNRLGGAYGDQSGDVSVSKCKVLKNQIAGIVLTSGTNWDLSDSIEYEGNVGKELWENAVFQTITPEEINKAIPVEEDEVTPQTPKTPEE